MADKKPWMDNVTMEGVRIVFRNFAGKQGRFNAAGQRNFGVLIDQELADKMEADGWTVKYLEPKPERLIENPDEPRQPWIKVKLHYGKGRPPVVAVIGETTKRRNDLDEDTVNILDWANIKNVDLVLRPHQWTIEETGKEGVTAYVKSIYVTIEEDILEVKYRNTEDSGQGPATDFEPEFDPR